MAADESAFSIETVYIYRWDWEQKYYYIDDGDVDDNEYKQFAYLAAMGQLGIYEGVRENDMYMIE